MASAESVVILLPDHGRAEDMARFLELNDHPTTVVDDAEDLFQHLNTYPVDVLVIENELGGFFTGLDLLSRICTQLTHPLIMLIADDPYEVRAESRRLGVNATLHAPSNPERVVDAIAGVLAASKLGGIEAKVPHRAYQLVRNVKNVAALPQLLTKVSAYLQAKDPSIKELAKDISVDPKVSAELLRLVNSSSAAVRTKITTVFEAVNLLGVTRSVSLILSTAVMDRQRVLARALSDELRIWYNRRSVLIAATASTFAERVEKVSPEVAFLLGIFQDLGTLVLATAYGDKYAAMVKRVCRIGHLTLDQLEQDEWGMTHADTSTALLQEWDVPGTLITPVFYHHKSECFPDFPEAMQSYLHSMAIGEAFANMIDGFTPHKLGRLNRLLAEFAGSDFPKEQYQAVLAESVDRAIEASRLFSIPIPKPDAVHRMVERVCREIETARASCGV